MSVEVINSYDSRGWAARPMIVDTGLRMKLNGRAWAVLLCTACQGSGSGWLQDASGGERARCPRCGGYYPFASLQEALDREAIDLEEGSLAIGLDAIVEAAGGKRA